VITVLAHGDHPEWYGLPRDPHVPWTVRFSKSFLRPLGFIAIFGTIAGVFGHFMRHGPKKPPDDAPATKPPPAARG